MRYILMHVLLQAIHARNLVHAGKKEERCLLLLGTGLDVGDLCWLAYLIILLASCKVELFHWFAFSTLSLMKLESAFQEGPRAVLAFLRFFLGQAFVEVFLSH